MQLYFTVHPKTNVSPLWLFVKQQNISGYINNNMNRRLICREVLVEKLSNGLHLHDRLESTEYLGYVSLS